MPYCRSWRDVHIGALSQVIMVDAQTYRQIVLMSKIGLKYQRAIEILLIEVVEPVAILGIELVHRS